jgi:hypothetical protein
MADKQPMGIGKLGDPKIIIKRKFRFTFEISTPCGSIPAAYCKISARPNLEIEETELNFLNAVTWLPGKAKWQPISVTYLDVATKEMQGLYNWMATLYNFTDPVKLTQGEKGDWNGTAQLKLYDGCGATIETWLLNNVFPTGIDFGDLDYTSSDFCTIQLNLRYSDAQYMGGCGLTTPTACCKGCPETPATPLIGVTPGIQSVIGGSQSQSQSQSLSPSQFQGFTQ